MSHERITRRRQQLLLSLENPHPESLEWAELGLREWGCSLPSEDVTELLDPGAGHEVRWPDIDATRRPSQGIAEILGNHP